MRKALLGVAVAAGLSLAVVRPAAAEEMVCRGTLGAVTVDNLRVPQGASCTLNGTRVKGTVKVKRAPDPAEVRGHARPSPPRRPGPFFESVQEMSLMSLALGR